MLLGKLLALLSCHRAPMLQVALSLASVRSTMPKACSSQVGWAHVCQCLHNPSSSRRS